eukprot:scaffold617989_cov23-Prasinocladus_malaysianus.AAC.1
MAPQLIPRASNLQGPSSSQKSCMRCTMSYVVLDVISVAPFVNTCKPLTCWHWHALADSSEDQEARCTCWPA